MGGTAPLSPGAAVIFAASLSVGFVGVLYLAPASLRGLSRNHPKLATFRIIATVLYSLVAITPTLVIQTVYANGAAEDLPVSGDYATVPIGTLHGIVGLAQLMWSTVRALGLVLVLFLGPVVVSLMHGFLHAILQADDRVRGHAALIQKCLVAVQSARIEVERQRNEHGSTQLKADSALDSVEHLAAPMPLQEATQAAEALEAARDAGVRALRASPGDWRWALPPLQIGMLRQAGQLAWEHVGRQYTSRDPTAAGELGPSLLLLRNLVAAPLTEEWVFRACVGAVLLQGGWSPGSVVLLSPLFFGVAHLHHCAHRVLQEGAPLRQAALESGLQFAYTALFGAFAGFVLLRTGSLGAAVAAHSLCNFFGLPDVGALLGPGRALGLAGTDGGLAARRRREGLLRLRRAQRALGAEIDGAGRVEEEAADGQEGAIRGAALTAVERAEGCVRGHWRGAARGAYVAGLALFAALVVPLTDPSCGGPCGLGGAAQAVSLLGVGSEGLEGTGEGGADGEVGYTGLPSCRSAACCRGSAEFWVWGSQGMGAVLGEGVGGGKEAVRRCGHGVALAWALGGPLRPIAGSEAGREVEQEEDQVREQARGPSVEDSPALEFG